MLDSFWVTTPAHGGRDPLVACRLISIHLIAVARLRLVVYEVRDAVTSTQVVLGAAEVDAALLLQEPALKRRLCLATPAGVGGAGFVTLATRNASDLGDWPFLSLFFRSALVFTLDVSGNGSRGCHFL